MLQQTFDLKQIINEATRLTPHSRTLIDLIFVSSENNVLNAGVLEPVCSDHCPIYLELCDKLSPEITHNFKRKIYDYKSVDIDGINTSLEDISSVELFSTGNINVATELLTEKLLLILNANIQNKTVTIRPKDPLWMNNEICHFMRKRNRVHKIAKSRNRPSEWADFRSIRNKVTSLVCTAKKEYLKKIDNELNSRQGTKTWWRLVKHYIKTTNSSHIFPPIISQDVMYEE